ncbi:hypothetical protein [Halobacterium salinarum]|uniref:DUF8103 domain-containing protein n=4 Tax=Halobacterium salinarum TaxID=2242 RepID=A0A510N812_HALSA|nr:hypothetical protein [Halobacterium salinarum]MBB6089150.1 hypothetical protein [Halobacterium salinarum]MDL0119579.1 hypothetical protein [Halobacterium salinarum]MDL0125946.1 hypothetical protein [Halobacterium salinarum]MDL0131223.1 hypothetical protein [Halobacterium salinarum]MDL0141913.1 hypothetical protein [Halobacterium salinarum]
MVNGNTVHEPTGSTAGQTADIEDPTWVVVKSLLETNTATTNALETVMLYAATDRIDDLPADALAAHLDDLIETQRRTITELELARDAISELNAEQ